MIVKCVTNRIDELSMADCLRADLREWFPHDPVRLTPGAEYVVYAIEIRDSVPWYFITDDDIKEYPIRYSAAFFEVVDNRLSKYWQFGFSYDQLNVVDDYRTVTIGFPELLDDAAFFARLLDSDESVQTIFDRMKSLMDLEYPRSSVKLTATVCDGEWLMCPKCFDAWESGSRDGLCRCPACDELLRNPRFESS